MDQQNQNLESENETQTSVEPIQPKYQLNGIIEFCHDTWPTPHSTRVTSISDDEDSDKWRLFHIIDESNMALYNYHLRLLKPGLKDNPLNVMMSYVVTLAIAAALHRYKVPKIIKYDITNNNRLNQPYIIETRFEGKSLAELLGTLDIAQKVQIARQLGEFHREIDQFPCARPGQPISIKIPKPNNITNQTDWASLSVQDLHRMKFSFAETFPFYKPAINFYAAIHNDLFIKYRGKQPHEESLTLIFKLITYIYNQCDVLKLPAYYLTHGKLHNANIRIHLDPEGKAEISGIEGWDDAMILPAIEAFGYPELCKPTSRHDPT
jgi:Phosphotransferase enzyme family